MVGVPERDLNAEYADLCNAAGHLFIMFGRLEGTLSAVLRLHLGNQLAVVDGSMVALPAAIYGSMRFKAARDTMKRIMNLQKVPDETKRFVLGVFEHVGHIETFRDYLAHQILAPAVEGSPFWQVNDTVTTRDTSKPKVYLFTAEAIRAAGDDLLTASERLGNSNLTRKLFEGLDGAPVPWRYKPSMLALVPQSKMRNL